MQDWCICFEFFVTFINKWTWTWTIYLTLCSFQSLQKIVKNSHSESIDEEWLWWTSLSLPRGENNELGGSSTSNCQESCDQRSLTWRRPNLSILFWSKTILYGLYCCNNLSWKFPGHILKSQGQNQMAGHIFFIFCSVTCPQHVLQISHMSNTLKK